jgi:hypothetical protein
MEENGVVSEEPAATAKVKVKKPRKARKQPFNLPFNEASFRVEPFTPAPTSKRGKYDFVTTLNIGDCYFLPKEEMLATQEAYHRVLVEAGRRRGVKLVTRMDADGFRVWRVEK